MVETRILFLLRRSRSRRRGGMIDRSWRICCNGGLYTSCHCCVYIRFYAVRSWCPITRECVAFWLRTYFLKRLFSSIVWSSLLFRLSHFSTLSSIKLRETMFNQSTCLLIFAIPSR